MKQTTIDIDGKPFTYNDEIDDISNETNLPISVEDATDLLLKVKHLFEEKGITYCLAFGTLLGAIRDSNIIPGDEDVDIIVESEEAILHNLPFFAENGLFLCRRAEHSLYSFRINSRSYVDVYFQYTLPICIWRLWCVGLIHRTLPRRLIKRYDTTLFLGDTYPVPYNPERILRFWYGKGWKLPVKSHNFKYDTASHYWWENSYKKKYHSMKRRIKSFIKMLLRFDSHKVKNHHP